MKAHRDFITEKVHLDVKAKEYLRREIVGVPKILDLGYPKFLTNFLFAQVGPRAHFKDFRVDMEYTDLDCFDEVEDFIFSDIS